MLAVADTPLAPGGAVDDEAMWNDLLCFLRPYARRLVHDAHIASWQGQQADLAEDIVQETMLRILERVRRIEAGALPPINSLKAFTVIVARHYCIDLQRRDSRLRRGAGSDCACESEEQKDLLALVTEHLSQEELFVRLAHCVARFPRKQREALLVDLAQLIHNEETSALQQALLAAGIDLRIYQRPLPDDPVERTRHVSLLSIAYKRIARCMRDEAED